MGHRDGRGETVCSRQDLGDSDKTRERGQGSHRGDGPLHILGTTVNFTFWVSPLCQDLSSQRVSFQGANLCSVSSSLMGTVVGNFHWQLPWGMPTERRVGSDVSDEGRVLEVGGSEVTSNHCYKLNIHRGGGGSP